MTTFCSEQFHLVALSHAFQATVSAKKFDGCIGYDGCAFFYIGNGSEASIFPCVDNSLRGDRAEPLQRCERRQQRIIQDNKFLRVGSIEVDVLHHASCKTIISSFCFSSGFSMDSKIFSVFRTVSLPCATRLASNASARIEK